MLTPATLGSLQIPAAAAPSAPALFNALAGQTLEATLEAVLPEGLLLRLADGKLLQAQGSLPFPPGSTLTLEALPLPEGAGVRLQVLRATQPPAPALLAPLVQGEAAPLLARLQAAGADPSPLAALFRSLVQAGTTVAEGPEAWSTWMKAVMKTLADPAASPAESLFHRLQAKEGTGWFELPLPWAQGAAPMRIWVEGDQPSKESSEVVHRVFLSVPFSTLGDVRLGVEQSHAGLRVRLWLQEPGQVAAIRAELEAELATLGRPVDLKVLALPPGAPDLRAMAGAPPLQAMG